MKAETISNRDECPVCHKLRFEHEGHNLCKLSKEDRSNLNGGAMVSIRKLKQNLQAVESMVGPR